jgi:DNA-binding response OmpR family regulator
MSQQERASILIVEDDVLIAIDLQHMLEGEGYQVIGPAFCAASALALIEDEAPALALLDANLGRTNSFELADVLLARKSKVIFVTGHSRGWISMSHRHHRLIAKPFLPEEVLAAVNSELNGARSAERPKLACRT